MESYTYTTKSYTPTNKQGKPKDTVEFQKEYHNGAYEITSEIDIDVIEDATSLLSFFNPGITQNNASDIELASREIVLSTTAKKIAFELPFGYVALQKDGYEGGHVSSISFGKELVDGYATYTPFEISIAPLQPNTNGGYDDSEEYLDNFIEKAKHIGLNPRYTKLFGNNAVAHGGVSGDGITLVGYIEVADEQTDHTNQYIVTVYVNNYSTGTVLNEPLFKTVIGSLRQVE